MEKIALLIVVLNCLCWTTGNRLLVGTAGVRLAWVVDGNLHFIDSFDLVAEREF